MLALNPLKRCCTLDLSAGVFCSGGCKCDLYVWVSFIFKKLLSTWNRRARQTTWKTWKPTPQLSHSCHYKASVVALALQLWRDRPRWPPLSPGSRPVLCFVRGEDEKEGAFEQVRLFWSGDVGRGRFPLARRRREPKGLQICSRTQCTLVKKYQHSLVLPLTRQGTSSSPPRPQQRQSRPLTNTSRAVEESPPSLWTPSPSQAWWPAVQGPVAHTGRRETSLWSTKYHLLRWRRLFKRWIC